MPTRLPDKPRAKSIPANDAHPDGMRSHARRETHPIETIDWLALWALSIAFSAIVLAALVFYGGRDATGASMVLFGAAAIIGVVLHVSREPPKAS